MARENLFQSRFSQHQLPIQVKNESGEEIPPHACMIIDPDGEWINDESDPWGFVIPVVKPLDENIGQAELNNVIINTNRRIGVDKTGVGIRSWPAVAAVDGSVKRGDLVGVENDNWELMPGHGLFKVFQIFDRGETKLAVIEEPTGGLVLKSPAGGIPARNASDKIFSADCKYYYADENDILTASDYSLKIWNAFRSSIAGNTFLTAKRVGNKLFIDAEDC